jgi:hypothetical protein
MTSPRPRQQGALGERLRRQLLTKSRPAYLVARSIYRSQRNVRRYIYWALFGRRTITDIRRFERRWHSQNGEDGILEIVFAKIGVTNRFCVEFGAESGEVCNTRYLMECKGWTGLRMDGGDHDHCFGTVYKEFVTAENINSLFRKYSVPQEFDLLSIDIDGNDYWVWRAIEGYSPRVVIIEYNSSLPPGESKTIQYDPKFSWDGTNYYGASLLALAKLGGAKGYTLIGCESRGVNAFFLRADLVKDRFAVRSVAELYCTPGHGLIVDGKFVGHPPTERVSRMVDV